MPGSAPLACRKRPERARLFAVLAAVVLGTAGCASEQKDLLESRAFWNRVFSKDTYQLYTPPIHQGNDNILDKRKVRRLKLGMTREHVRFLMGDPVTPSMFNMDRWDYVYYLIPSKGKRVSRKMSLFFERGRLVRICRNKRCHSAMRPYNPYNDEPGARYPA